MVMGSKRLVKGKLGFGRGKLVQPSLRHKHHIHTDRSACRLLKIKETQNCREIIDETERSLATSVNYKQKELKYKLGLLGRIHLCKQVTRNTSCSLNLHKDENRTKSKTF